MAEASDTTYAMLDPGDDRFRALADSSSLLIWISDPQSRVAFFNRRWLEFTGRTLEEELGDGWIDGVHPDDRVRVERYMRAQERRGEPYTQQYRVLAADGEYRTVVDAASPMLGANGELLGYAGTTLDITEQLRQEQSRIEAEGLLTIALEASPVGVGFVDERLRFVRLNRTLAELHDLPVEAHIGRSVRDVLAHLDLGIDLESVYRRVLESGAASTGIDVRVGEGATARSLMCSYYPVCIDGRIAGVGVVSVDVTEREQLEAQLLQSQKLEAVGRLAGGLAHDFNNLLGVIDGYAHLIADSLSADDELRRQALEISKASSRGADLTRRLLSFSRQQVIVTSDVDVGSVVVDLARLLERLVPSTVTLRIEVGDGPAFVRADSSRLGQVLVNLVINAIDAMPGGGDLAIRVERSAAHVRLTVSDTGAGIDAHALPRIFEPFFTTKEHGTGLGLSTVHGVVEQLGGQVSVASSPGAGATFVVTLPRVRGVVGVDDADAATPSTVAARAGGETVLVAEDNDLLRSLIRSVLERAGYCVRLAADGGEALALLLAEGPPALVVADVEMPSMGGLELARRVEEAHAGTPVLLISGYAEDGDADDLARREFLQKPFTPAQLVERVGSLLEQRGRSPHGSTRSLD